MPVVSRSRRREIVREIGHTLGLGHGGSSAINCKPNYVSIMSYTFQTMGK